MCLGSGGLRVVVTVKSLLEQSDGYHMHAALNISLCPTPPHRPTPAEMHIYVNATYYCTTVLPQHHITGA